MHCHLSMPTTALNVLCTNLAMPSQHALPICGKPQYGVKVQFTKPPSITPPWYHLHQMHTKGEYGHAIENILLMALSIIVTIRLMAWRTLWRQSPNCSTIAPYILRPPFVVIMMLSTWYCEYKAMLPTSQHPKTVFVQPLTNLKHSAHTTANHTNPCTTRQWP